MKASYFKHILDFKRPSGTSRGILKTKETWFLILNDKNRWGIGECGIFRGLSRDDRPDYKSKLKWTCDHIDLGATKLYESLTEFPSIQFGLEIAFKSLKAENPFELFPSEFTQENAAMPINGLIWMGDITYMKQQIAEKIDHGFRCIKLKIGAIDFISEIDLLKSIRMEFSANDIELRVDANGAFLPTEAMEKLKRLSELHLHSIEQPIRQGQWDEMAQLCENTPLPIALDEELIGIFSSEQKRNLLSIIKPQYIILKPSLIGGFQGTDEWIELAKTSETGWWVTSALESNIGLNAISQYTFTKNSKLPQGLGTGSLFTNNIASPLEIEDGKICYNSGKQWDTELFSSYFTKGIRN